MMSDPSQNDSAGTHGSVANLAPVYVQESLSQARARADNGDILGALAAIDHALSLEPRNVTALMMKADHLLKQGDPRAATAFYAAVARLPAASVRPEWNSEVVRAREMVRRYSQAFEEYVRTAMELRGFGPKQAPPRFSRAIEVLVGKARAYAQEPRYFYYPELAAIQFFDRKDFPFLDAVEAAYPDIRAELDALIAEGADFAPYVVHDQKRPPSSQRGLVDNSAWTAFFLMKEGARTVGADRCPNTMAALSNAPLAAIPNRTPAVLFSRLTPGAHIPAHTGMINTRLICHLAVKTNQHCAFRVGNETRVWEQGKAWVFDDTIDHEAWNKSDEDRTILIFDIWRPDIPEDERLGFIALCEAIDEFNGRQAWND
ncbi:MAG: aspartyl/asparaginyl beta-hydroxylase domain-containing protein [Hyphomonadaceae bacterium]|nr:aspartyl/asparaginyl beta-hydroxylase domain-containing protein [Hyphomonadaceae bacterium]